MIKTLLIKTNVTKNWRKKKYRGSWSCGLHASFRSFGNTEKFLWNEKIFGLKTLFFEIGMIFEFFDIYLVSLSPFGFTQRRSTVVFYFRKMDVKTWFCRCLKEFDAEPCSGSSLSGFISSMESINTLEKQSALISLLLWSLSEPSLSCFSRRTWRCCALLHKIILQLLINDQVHSLVIKFACTCMLIFRCAWYAYFIWIVQLSSSKISA